MDITTSTVDEISVLVARALGIPDRLEAMNASTGLLGEMPEFDSMAVAELIALIEEQYGIDPDEADLTAEIFETVGTLAAFVEDHRTRGPAASS
jgi:acyl carrier protein